MNDTNQNIGNVENSDVRYNNINTIRTDNFNINQNSKRKVKANDKYWFSKYWYVIISVSSLIANYIVLALVFPRITSKENLGFDYMGVVVGILTLLVMFTVGWQIINAMEVKKELDNARELQEEFDKTINIRLNEILSNACNYMGDIAEMVSKSRNARWEYFATSIQYYNKYKEKDISIMVDISKSHIQDCVNEEVKIVGEITPCLTLCVELSRLLDTNDIIQLYADIKSEKGYENVIKLLETIMPMIKWNQKIMEEVQGDKKL